MVWNGTSNISFVDIVLDGVEVIRVEKVKFGIKRTVALFICFMFMSFLAGVLLSERVLVNPVDEYSETTAITCYTSDATEVDIEVWYVYEADERLNVMLDQSVVSSTRALISQYTFKDITVNNVSTIEKLLTEKVDLENQDINVERVTISSAEKVKRGIWDE